MKKTRLVVAGLALAALTTIGAGTAAYAHHAFAAEFDADAPVLLKGKVVTVEWVNPHTWIHINVPDTDGKGKLKKDSLKMGTEVVVRGYQSKDALCDVHPKTKKKTCKANGRDVTFPNGCKLFVGSSGTGSPKDGSDASEDKSASAANCNAAAPA